MVLGSLDHDMQEIASIDADHFDCGRLLAQYLFEKGHERIALLGISNGRPGDHQFLDGIAEAMTEAGKPANSLIARLCPNDLDTLRAQALSTLSSEHRPTGIICRGERMLNLVLPIVEQLGLQVPEDVELVYETFSTIHVGHVPYPCVETSRAVRTDRPPDQQHAPPAAVRHGARQRARAGAGQGAQQALTRKTTLAGKARGRHNSQ